MPRDDWNMIARKLVSVLSARFINELGKETGFAVRLRATQPARLAIAAVDALGTQQVSSLADILRTFNSVAPVSVEYKPLHNQLRKQAFHVFARRLFEAVPGELVLDVLAPVPSSVLEAFDDIVLQDGGSFALHKALAGHFPGRFTKVSPAAVELHARMSLFRMSLLTDQSIQVDLSPDKESERARLPEPASLANKLFMADAGYEDLLYFNRMVEAGGTIPCRLKSNTTPKVHAAWLDGKAYRFQGGIRLKDLRCAQEGRNADLDVQWVRKGKKARFRPVLVWNPERRSHMVLVTNIDRHLVSSVSTIRNLHRLGWRIELLFKEWKSFANLHWFATRIPAMAEGLIRLSLTAAAIKRFLVHAAERVHQDNELSTQRAAKALANTREALLVDLPATRAIMETLRATLEYLNRNARRAHPKRDRRSGRPATGLRHARTHRNGPIGRKPPDNIIYIRDMLELNQRGSGRYQENRLKNAG